MIVLKMRTSLMEESLLVVKNIICQPLQIQFDILHSYQLEQERLLLLSQFEKYLKCERIKY